jgi:hypothetical protein
MEPVTTSALTFYLWQISFCLFLFLYYTFIWRLLQVVVIADVTHILWLEQKQLWRLIMVKWKIFLLIGLDVIIDIKVETVLLTQ